MKTKIAFGLVLVLIIFVGQAIAAPPVQEYSEQDVEAGPANGNHDLDCTIIRPWSDSSGPGSAQYPVIVWANGWGGNDQAGEYTTLYYKSGLIAWALDGPYIVVAANQWSVQESDVLACLQWIVDQNTMAGSEYEGVVNTAKIGLVGHSQGGGAVIKAGDGEPNGFDITTVVALNPYGPSWVDAGSQDGPMMIIGGSNDLVTPVPSFLAVWEAIQVNDQGGLLAVLQGGTHDLGDWGPDAFGDVHQVTELWWQYHLNDNAAAGRALERALNKAPWDTLYAFTDEFEF